jgi:hypothetical protein
MIFDEVFMLIIFNFFNLSIFLLEVIGFIDLIVEVFKLIMFQFVT